MITREYLSTLLANRTKDGVADPLIVLSWDPFTLASADDSWTGTDIPAHMLLAKAVLDEAQPKKGLTMPDKELEDVRAFHQKFGFIDSGRVPTMVTQRKLRERAECLQEELDEFKNAIESQDFAEQADALIDLVYFAKGTAVIMGLPWEQLWMDVQRANISKERGITKRGHAFDVIKPEGWQKPNGVAIIEAAGFDLTRFMTDGVVDESKCLDEPNPPEQHPRKIQTIQITDDMSFEDIQILVETIRDRIKKGY